MQTLPRHVNPFALMIDPQAVIAQIEGSGRLERLQRRVCRPLDKPLLGGAADGEDGATSVGADLGGGDRDIVTVASDAPAFPTEHGARRALRCAWLPALALALGGCAAQIEVRSLATGRGDVSAHALNGPDLDSLRRAAQRLCPLGGEILRQAGQQPPPEAAGGRWRSALGTAVAWVEPPREPAQLLVLCHEGGERMRLQAAAPLAAPPASAALPVPNLNAALPVGPITPQW